MAKSRFGVNLEFVRHDDKPFEWGVEKAAELGYDVRRADGPLGPRAAQRGRLLPQRLDARRPVAHQARLRSRRASSSPASPPTRPLCKPEIGTEYLKQAIRFAAECGAPVVNTDEGPKRRWTTEDEDFVLMRYTLDGSGQGRRAARHPHRPRVPPAVQQAPRRAWTASTSWSKSPAIGINFDTGNATCAARTPTQWLKRVVKPPRPPARQGHLRPAIRRRARQGHRHAGRLRLRRRRDRLDAGHRDLPQGCPRDIVFSVECGTVEQAERSVAHLKPLLSAKRGA